MTDPLADLRWHWGDAYAIDGDLDTWTATRRDTGAVLRAETPGQLFDLIRYDYERSPVPRSM